MKRLLLAALLLSAALAVAQPPPKRAVIGKHVYSIHVVKKLSEPANVGEMIWESHTINMRSDQSDDDLRDTLTHELFHACWVEEFGPEAGMPPDDESVVLRLTPCWLKLLRGNPRVVSYLTGR